MYRDVKKLRNGCLEETGRWNSFFGAYSNDTRFSQ